MLLTVEGGGFFSSSASGYTNGLALLLFGRKNEQPMKVSPWSSYQLVEHEFEPEPQSTTTKSQGSGGFISFNCFRHAHAQLDGQSPSKIRLVKQSEISTDTSSDTSKTTASDTCYKSDRKPCLKDKLKKPSRDCSTYKDVDANELIEQTETETSCCTVGRKVQWTDKCGKELVEVREFELSDYGVSDDEFEHEKLRRCECVIQ
ncbi:uncharacterized protein LOC122029122 [Zingiber officinale]|uniref:uncharacterized protein LOC122029122 n=1 Tax=Zingiber officinale TaxID=94328 RepID=UPI001C4BF6DF|nr:uncharacterized protein LOC122029122 [Zingiber officinale]XP_042444015.1 uncharacterized protein LOC122029122 [Zingiber officinale]